jgi:hypothetical protein
MPTVPEDDILDKYITLKQTQHLNKNPPPETIFRKESNLKLNYPALFNSSPHGSIQTFVHKNHELTLISSNYLHIS